MILLRKLARAVLKFLGVAEIVGLLKGALREYGWVRSARSNASVDASGEALPWITYPAIHILETRITPGLRVFEFGSGNSTLWWAKRVTSVHTVEHDRAWFEAMEKRVPENVTLRFVPLEYGGSYSKAAQAMGPFDIIVVDGRDRVNCIKQSLASLSQAGVIVLDNSERVQYVQGVDFLLANGFKRLPLRGMGPIVTYLFETSLFYRNENVLGL